MFLLYASCFELTIFQMNVKSAFLNGFMQEEVYVKQPPRFENSKFPNHVFKLQKALYGLKQAPRAWYDRLKKYFMKNGFVIGTLDPTFFVLKKKSDLFIVQIYVDDIIFGATNKKMCRDFAKNIQYNFEMKMIGELKYFLGLKINQ